MKRTVTSRDLQRNDFVASLYQTLKRETEEAINDRCRYASAASEYLGDGLDPLEATELLIVDGLSRDEAEGYIVMAQEGIEDEEGLHAYAYTFEDTYGRIWSSHEVGEAIRASSEDEAWAKAEAAVDSCDDLDAERVISVSKIA